MVIDTSYINSNDSRVDSTGTIGTPKEKALVEVVWLDIVCHADWTEAGEVSCPEFKSIGWFISQSEKEVKIGNTKDDTDKIFGVTAFPNGCIVRINVL